MFLHPDFLSEADKFVSAFQALPDNELCSEYMILQALYNAYDDMADTLNYPDSYLVHYLDYFESYIQQEICQRLCSQSLSMSVPRYPMV